MKRIFYWLRAKYRAWSYKRKYGVDIHEAICEYGKKVILTEEVVSKCHCKKKIDCVCTEIVIFRRFL